jgi:hypothetical protein
MEGKEVRHSGCPRSRRSQPGLVRDRRLWRCPSWGVQKLGQVLLLAVGVGGISAGWRFFCHSRPQPEPALGRSDRLQQGQTALCRPLRLGRTGPSTHVMDLGRSGHTPCRSAILACPLARTGFHNSISPAISRPTRADDQRLAFSHPPRPPFLTTCD